MPASLRHAYKETPLYLRATSNSHSRSLATVAKDIDTVPMTTPPPVGKLAEQGHPGQSSTLATASATVAQQHQSCEQLVTQVTSNPQCMAHMLQVLNPPISPFIVILWYTILTMVIIFVVHFLIYLGSLFR